MSSSTVEKHPTEITLYCLPGNSVNFKSPIGRLADLFFRDLFCRSLSMHSKIIAISRVWIHVGFLRRNGQGRGRLGSHFEVALADFERLGGLFLTLRDDFLPAPILLDETHADRTLERCHIVPHAGS